MGLPPALVSTPLVRLSSSFAVSIYRHTARLTRSAYRDVSPSHKFAAQQTGSLPMDHPTAPVSLIVVVAAVAASRVLRLERQIPSPAHLPTFISFDIRPSSASQDAPIIPLARSPQIVVRIAAYQAVTGAECHCPTFLAQPSPPPSSFLSPHRRIPSSSSSRATSALLKPQHPPHPPISISLLGLLSPPHAALGVRLPPATSMPCPRLIPRIVACDRSKK